MDSSHEHTKQLERIQAMEQRLDHAAAVLAQVDDALEKIEAAQDDLNQLYDYYGSDVWQADYDDDAAGKLPADLKRGVLSQDAVYDLMSDHRRLLETMKQLSEALDTAAPSL